MSSKAGSPLRRGNRDNGKNKIPVWENTGNLEILQKHRDVNLSHKQTGNFRSNYKFPDFKMQDIGIFAVKFSNFSNPVFHIQIS